MIISYAITVCDEHKELDRLLSFLIKNIREGDEIIVQCDEENTTPEVLKVLNKCADRIKVIEFPLNNHFANFKNNLSKNCMGDYIMNIDADEIPNVVLIDNLSDILMENESIDVYYVPRINTVEGLTPSHIEKWNWGVNEKGWVNYPDYQMRIYKNKPEIKWVNKVHEVLEGYISFSTLPPEEELSLYHPKSIEKQEKQNNYYSTL
tara:strand:- start:1806 stop:2423 length:618 start_codon:yes stop_codon:yes gene_type:complete